MELILKAAGIIFIVLIGFNILMRIVYSGPSKLNKRHASNKISDKDFEALQKLFDDSLNILATAETIQTKKVAQAVRLTALAIAKSVDSEQKGQLVENSRWISSMSIKAGMPKQIADKYEEMIAEINSKDWEMIDVVKARTDLREADELMIEAVLNFEGDHLQKRFPKHFN